MAVAGIGRFIAQTAAVSGVPYPGARHQRGILNSGVANYADAVQQGQLRGAQARFGGQQGPYLPGPQNPSQYFGGFQTPITSGPAVGLQNQLNSVSNIQAGGAAAGGVGQGVGQAQQGVLTFMQSLQRVVKEFGVDTQEWAEATDGVNNAFSKLTRDIETSFSDIRNAIEGGAEDLARFIQGVDDAGDSVEAWNEAQKTEAENAGERHEERMRLLGEYLETILTLKGEYGSLGDAVVAAIEAEGTAKEELEEAEVERREVEKKREEERAKEREKHEEDVKTLGSGYGSLGDAVAAEDEIAVNRIRGQQTEVHKYTEDVKTLGGQYGSLGDAVVAESDIADRRLMSQQAHAKQYREDVAAVQEQYGSLGDAVVAAGRDGTKALTRAKSAARQLASELRKAKAEAQRLNEELAKSSGSYDYNGAGDYAGAGTANATDTQYYLDLLEDHHDDYQEWADRGQAGQDAWVQRWKYLRQMAGLPTDWNEG